MVSSINAESSVLATWQTLIFSQVVPATPTEPVENTQPQQKAGSSQQLVDRLGDEQSRYLRQNVFIFFWFWAVEWMDWCVGDPRIHDTALEE